MKWLALVLMLTGCFAPDEPFGPRRGWEFTGEVPPGAMHGAKLTWDQTRGGVVMYTGRHRDQMSLPGQLWLWKNKLWTQICKGGVEGMSRPTPVYLPAFTWEPTYKQLVLAGGARVHATGGLFDDISDEIWTCDETDNWTKLTSKLAIGRAGASLLNYPQPQPRNDVLVLVGGRNAGGQLKNMEISPADASAFEVDPIPMTFASAGAGQSATYDDDSHQIFALETELTPDDFPTLHDAMWKFDGMQWTQFCEDCTGTARSDASLVHFGDSVETYLVGGYIGGGDSITGTWILDHEKFVKVFNEPATRNGIGVAYDGTADTLVGYGGTSPDCASGECPDTIELVVTEAAHAP